MRPDSSVLLERRVCWMRVVDRAYSATPLLLRLKTSKPSNADPPHRVRRNEHLEALPAVGSVDSLLTI